MKNDTNQKISGTSLDISKENKDKLRQLFPTVFTETINEKGEIVETIDIDKLKAELGTFSEYYEGKREHYGMDWPGKKEALRLIQTPSAATLKPCREESVNFDTTENLFIEGDNLEVLKLLQKSYYGKVKMIYIDPPYNTGKEFIYPDNFTESLDTYLEYAGLVDSNGKKFLTNTANEGRFHTKWINMMYPRIYLARNLLRNDGVIFISIDDNEVTNLRKLCDEIYGEDNFVSSIAWQSRTSIQNDTDLSVNHEYILIYAKKRRHIDRRLKESNFDKWFKIKEFAAYPMPLNKEKFSNPDNDKRGDWKADPFDAPNIRANLTYKIVNPTTNQEYLPPRGRCWRTEEAKYLNLLNDNRILFGKSGNSGPMLKVFYNEKKVYGEVEDTWFDGNNYGTATEGTKEIQELFDNRIIFDTAKPTRLIRALLRIATKGNNLVLDFFSGASTSAHAILEENSKKLENNHYILVQLPEPCAEDSEAFKAGYKTIADIGKERIRRVIKKLNDEDSGKLELGDGKKQDRGFKVLKLDRSNFKQWRALSPDTKPEKISEQLELHVEHVVKTASQEDLLFEVLIKAGFLPTEKIEKKEIAGKQVFSVSDGLLLVCFEATVTKELIENVAALRPMQFICLDSAFEGNDQLKANAVETFKSYNQGKENEEKIVFKTI